MQKTIKWLSALAAIAAAVVYILGGTGVLSAGNIGADDAPPAIFYVAGAFYIIVAYLIRIEKRWLCLTLGVINALVILIFFQMWWGHTDVLTSPAGIGTKIPQFVLEIGLIYHIIKVWNKNRRNRLI